MANGVDENGLAKGAVIDRLIMEHSEIMPQCQQQYSLTALTMH